MTRMDWGRLGDTVVTRRVRLGMRSQKEFAARSGLSLRLISDLERGNRSSYDPSTFARLEKALDWVPGSVQVVLGGGDPVPAGESAPAQIYLDPRSLERYGDDQELLALIESAGLSPADKFRAALRVRRRRAEQHAELVAELRHMLGLPDGDDTEETG